MVLLWASPYRGPLNLGNQEGVHKMQFNVRWPIQSAQLRAGAMLLAIVVMAIAGSAGTRWH